MLTRVPVRHRWFLYGVLLLVAGYLSTGMAEGSDLLLLWFSAPASLIVWTGLLAPFYWYVFGLAVEERRAGRAVRRIGSARPTA